MLSELLEAHAVAPISTQSWMALPAAALVTLVGDGRLQSSLRGDLLPFAAILTATLECAFSDNLGAWEMFFALMGEFAGPINELIELTVLMNELPAQPN